MNTFNWNYNPDHYTSNIPDILDEGDYRVCITSAKSTVAKNGTEGLEITFDVNGHSNNLKHYIWFNPDDVQRTNVKLGQFFNSFAIAPDEQNNCVPWINKKGAVHVIHSEYKGRTIAKVAFCIEHDKQDKLPDWQDDSFADEIEKSFKESQTVTQPFTSWKDFDF